MKICTMNDLHDETWQPVTPTSPPWNGVPVLVWKDGDSVWISGRKRTPYAGMNHDWYVDNGGKMLLLEYSNLII